MISRDGLDHCPLILKVEGWDRDPKPFWFNIFWLENRQFKRAWKGCRGIAKLVENWSLLLFKSKYLPKTTQYTILVKLISPLYFLLIVQKSFIPLIYLSSIPKKKKLSFTKQKWNLKWAFSPVCNKKLYLKWFFKEKYLKACPPKILLIIYK